MSLTNVKFKGAVDEIVAQLTIKASADDKIKAIKDRMKEENDFIPAELTKYAAKVFQKMEKPEKYNEEADLLVRVFEEVDNLDV